MSLSEYIERVQSLPCVLCWKKLGVKTWPVEAHHVGEASERNDWAVAALCWEHHQGATGVHGLRRRGFERLWKVNDIDLLAWTNEAMSKF
jgi:hypothetical protein